MLQSKMSARCCGLAVFLLVTVAAGDEFETIRNRIKHRLVRDQVPSLAVAVARDGKIIWEEGFGWADREERRRATAHTMYSLASISKPITATGLMVLAERKKYEALMEQQHNNVDFELRRQTEREVKEAKKAMGQAWVSPDSAMKWTPHSN